MFKTAAVYDTASRQLLQKLQLKISSGDYEKQVKVLNELNRRRFRIQRTAKKRNERRSIRNEVAAAFQNSIRSITNHTLTVTILAKALPSDVRRGTKPLVLTLIGRIIGFLVGLRWIVLRLIKQATINSKDSLIKASKAPVLGVIRTN